MEHKNGKGLEKDNVVTTMNGGVTTMNGGESIARNQCFKNQTESVIKLVMILVYWSNHWFIG
jgi:hypothetical protein